MSGLQRIGGDQTVVAEVDVGAGAEGADVWRCGRARITTALPVGYPPPTPPGAIDLKLYPSVRRAEFVGRVTPDVGMNLGFWPLLGHIKSRSIAMTAPVEMDYPALASGAADEASPWTMSFLYREADMGALGEDGTVRVVDREPTLVVALGTLGDYRWERAQADVARLRQWLDAHAEFEAVGAPRALYYNGPEQRPADKWGEVQIPVKRRTER